MASNVTLPRYPNKRGRPVTENPIHPGASSHCSYGVCHSNSRRLGQTSEIKFITFPMPCLKFRNGGICEKTCPACVKAKRWLKLCGRIDGNFEKLKDIKRWSKICSLHFVGGHGPTEEYPDPLPANASSTVVTKQVKRKAPLVRSSVPPPKKLNKSKDGDAVIEMANPLHFGGNPTTSLADPRSKQLRTYGKLDRKGVTKPVHSQQVSKIGGGFWWPPLEQNEMIDLNPADPQEDSEYSDEVSESGNQDQLESEAYENFGGDTTCMVLCSASLSLPEGDPAATFEIPSLQQQNEMINVDAATHTAPPKQVNPEYPDEVSEKDDQDQCEPDASEKFGGNPAAALTVPPLQQRNKMMDGGGATHTVHSQQVDPDYSDEESESEDECEPEDDEQADPDYSDEESEGEDECELKDHEVEIVSNQETLVKQTALKLFGTTAYSVHYDAHTDCCTLVDSVGSTVKRRIIFCKDSVRMTIFDTDLPPDHPCLSLLKKLNFVPENAEAIIGLIETWAVCQGMPDDGGTFTGSVRVGYRWKYKETNHVHSKTCQLVISGAARKDASMCSSCRSLSVRFARAKVGKSGLIPSEKMQHRLMDRDELLAKLSTVTKKVKYLQRQYNEAKVKQKYSNTDDEKFFKEILKNMPPDFEEKSAFNVFLKSQLVASTKNNKHGIRWHPAIIKMCQTWQLKSSASYEAIRNSGYMHLPAKGTVRSYCAISSKSEDITVGASETEKSIDALIAEMPSDDCTSLL